ncbi:lytic transglycosylase domain-containing protein [uncultured Amnibacterium sp.]|uniref:aggregation-promoting factor C-terminal-like domain-containing protein n=1 Tax=uncultured Amnibacterium sp. TaxID=1631851 RepID=UPI0035CCA82B
MSQTVDAPRTRPAAVPVRRRSRSRFVLGLFAMLASAGIALVSVTDPYAGATAAPFYQRPVLAKASGVQRYTIDGGYVLVDIRRDSYRVVDTPAAAPAADDASSSSSAASTGAASYTTPVGTAQTFAARAVAKRGWAPSEFSCLVSLWNRESGWNTHAANPSGAYGIPQALPGSKMASAGGDWQNSYETQITWGLGYISGSYGSPCGAWAHSNASGWY